MISVKIRWIIFKVFYSVFIIFNDIFLTSFCLQPSELNGIINIVKKNYSFLIGKTGGRLTFRYILFIWYLRYFKSICIILIQSNCKSLKKFKIILKSNEGRR
jgi:hypothetical protein